MNFSIKQFRRKVFPISTKHYQSEYAYPLRFPRVVHIENTNACPSRCIMCPMDSMSRPSGVMSIELFEKLIRECSKYPEVESVHLHGFGEPLIDKNLPQKTALAKKLGIQNTYIVTTGSLLTAKTARELIIAGLDGIKFSFYGMTKATYESIHRRLNFENSVKNIEMFFGIRDELKAPNPMVRFQFSRSLAPKDEYVQFINHWLPFMDQDRGDIFLTTGLHNWAGGKNYTEISTPEDRRHCIWPFHDIQILWDGRVSPCVFDFDGTYILGNVNDMRIQEIWKSEQYCNLRKSWNQKCSNDIDICKKCDEPEGIFSPEPSEESYQPISRGILSHNQILNRKIKKTTKMIFHDLIVTVNNKSGNKYLL